MKIFEYKIKDEIGIHARPAGLLTKKSKEYNSEITITKGDKTVSCAKLMAVMGLGVKCGDTVTITANGTDEETAIAGLKEFFEKNF